MSITKNALLRYKTIDRCCQNSGRTYSIDDLLEEVNLALLEDDPKSSGINIRQLRGDIRFMRSESGYNAPIETKIYTGKKHAYFYSDPGFSIHNSPLNETEAKQLKSALELFQRFSGSPGFEWVDGLQIMLKEKLGGGEDKVISFENNIDYSGYHWISFLFNSIVQKKVLQMRYAPFGQDAFEMTFHPYYLKQYNNRWFVFGLNELKQISTWTMALDRIEAITELHEPYVPSDRDWEFYFSDIIGVTRFDGELEEVVLLFNNKQGKYIETKPLHESQRGQWTENGYTVKLSLVPNRELEQVILSFGEDVRVLNPVSLVIKLKARIELMWALQNESND